MKRVAALLSMAVTGMALAAAAAEPAPQPSLIPTAWQLEFKYQPPQAIRVRVPGEGVQTYWYVLYTVTNNTGKDLIFVPQFTLYADNGQLIHSGRGVSPTVFEEIQRIHSNPLMQEATAVTGLLLQGEDNAKDGVAIFRDIDPDARGFDLLVGGLSGEAAAVDLPVPVKVQEVDVDGNLVDVTKKSILLHRTLDATYKLPGEYGARLNSQPRLVEEKWVMR